MMNQSRRQLLPSTGSGGASNKRRERDGYIDGFKPSVLTTKNLARPSIHHRAPAPVKFPKPAPPAAAAAAAANANNKLLAGYLAHEFLTGGTLFGEPWDPARAEALPASSSSSSSSSSRGRPANPTAEKRKAEPDPKAEEDDEEKRLEKQRRYLEVADLLRTDGVHIPGIVNPTQLARFLQLG